MKFETETAKNAAFFEEKRAENLRNFAEFSEKKPNGKLRKFSAENIGENRAENEAEARLAKTAASLDFKPKTRPARGEKNGRAEHRSNGWKTYPPSRLLQGVRRRKKRVSER